MSRSEIDIEKLLRDLQNEETFRRKTAAEELGKLNTQDERVISALKTAATSDNNKYVRGEAKKALHTLGHELSSEAKTSMPAMRENVARKGQSLPPTVASERPPSFLVLVVGVLIVIAILFFGLWIGFMEYMRVLHKSVLPPKPTFFCWGVDNSNKICQPILRNPP